MVRFGQIRFDSDADRRAAFLRIVEKAAEMDVPYTKFARLSDVDYAEFRAGRIPVNAPREIVIAMFQIVEVAIDSLGCGGMGPGVLSRAVTTITGDEWGCYDEVFGYVLALENSVGYDKPPMDAEARLQRLLRARRILSEVLGSP